MNTSTTLAIWRITNTRTGAVIALIANANLAGLFALCRRDVLDLIVERVRLTKST